VDQDEDILRISISDQGAAAAHDFADMIGIFFNTLRKKHEVEPIIAMQLTIAWLQYSSRGNQSG